MNKNFVNVLIGVIAVFFCILAGKFLIDDKSPQPNSNIQTPISTAQTASISSTTPTSTSTNNSNESENWVVVHVINGQTICWTLKNTILYFADGNKAWQDDTSPLGIYWTNSAGNTISLNFYFDFVQVNNNNFEDAYQQLHVNEADCP